MPPSAMCEPEKELIARARSLAAELGWESHPSSGMGVTVADGLIWPTARLHDWSLPDGARGGFVRRPLLRLLAAVFDRQTALDESLVADLALLTIEVERLLDRVGQLEEAALRGRDASL